MRRTASIALALLPPPCVAIVSLPNMEFNAALGQIPYASSHYAFEFNPLLDTKYVPGNAIDGLVIQTSWWSSGAYNESVFFQVNFTTQSPVISKIIIRWHGYMAAKSYEIKTSFSGIPGTFVTFNTFEDPSTTWDRIDTVTPWINTSTRFTYLRVYMYSPIECNANNTVRCTTRRLGDMQQGPIYGIRELEVWAASQKSAAEGRPWVQFLAAFLALVSI
ncbi:unnamed protein product [Aphanomyces euteiches]|uniref:F5/8 type C domain-containing protein n=1 Tax=Aphanomyces euteiches TaxID=100861 RepID=A0A6G0WSA4_9STRA|nr:hypothetical protein Ae201684_012311 [Aphanomyces euteiches]KAH9096639.1 hypothetical protein Ae201684P_013305 [Aphanomyces euteiches]KAH9135634.1 hypothetical protein AeRB84_019010 [Aphanomyces euteiches]